MIKTYRNSGKFSPTFFVFALLALVVAMPLAWLYQFLMALIPFIYLNLAITAGFGFLMWLAMSEAVERGRCRNTVLAVVVALVVGLGGIGATHYFGYLATLSEIAEYSNLDDGEYKELVEEFPFSAYLEMRADAGWTFGKAGRSNDGPPISGLFVWLVWGIEALIVAGAGVYGAFGAVRRAFCEPCGEWSVGGSPFIFPAASGQTFAAVASAQSVDDLFALKSEGTGMVHVSLLFQPMNCPSCSNTHHLSLIRRELTYDDKGNETVKNKDLLTNVILTPEEAARFIDPDFGLPPRQEHDPLDDERFAPPQAEAQVSPSTLDEPGEPVVPAELANDWKPLEPEENEDRG